MKDSYLTITPGEVPTRVLHGYLLGSTAPRPIGFASTIDRNGTPNLAPFSFYNVFSAKPPICIFSPARRVLNNTVKHTLENVYQVPEVVINMVSYEIVEQMSLSSTDYPREANEFVKSGLTPINSDLVRPMRVMESPVQYECKVIEIKPLSASAGAGQLIICEILKLHIKKEILDEQGMIDPHKIDLVARMGANYYCRASGEAVFEVEKPMARLGIGVDSLPAFVRDSAILRGNDLGKLGNVESLPASSEVDKWVTANKGKVESIESLHEHSRNLLKENKKEEALTALLSQPYLF